MEREGSHRSREQLLTVMIVDAQHATRHFRGLQLLRPRRGWGRDSSFFLGIFGSLSSPTRPPEAIFCCMHVFTYSKNRYKCLAMAFDFPPWAIKAVDKIRHGFLWRGRKDAKGGHCLVAWIKVCRPPELGGLGILELKTLGWSIRMRWAWLQKTEPHRPWAALPSCLTK